MFDSCDHYLSNYLLLLVGIQECFGVGWVFDAYETAQKSEEHKRSLIMLTQGFWLPLIVIAIVTVVTNDTLIGVPIFAAVFFYTGVLPSYLVWKGSLLDWINEIFFCGVRKINYTITRLSRNPAEWNVVKTWEHVWFVYWGFCIKYFCTCALTFLMIHLLKGDIVKPYGGYHLTIQLLGGLVPLLGFISFVFGIFFIIQDE